MARHTGVTSSPRRPIGADSWFRKAQLREECSSSRSFQHLIIPLFGRKTVRGGAATAAEEGITRDKAERRGGECVARLYLGRTKDTKNWRGGWEESYTHRTLQPPPTQGSLLLAWLTDWVGWAGWLAGWLTGFFFFPRAAAARHLTDSLTHHTSQSVPARTLNIVNAPHLQLTPLLTYSLCPSLLLRVCLCVCVRVYSSWDLLPREDRRGESWLVGWMCCCVVVVCVVCGVVVGAGKNLPAAVYTQGTQSSLPRLWTTIWSLEYILSSVSGTSVLANPSHVTGLWTQYN